MGNAYGAVMLSTAKIRRGSWRYYANQVGHGACEYYLGLGEAPGRWQGRGLEELGLTAGDRVSERALEATFGRAVHPRTGQALGRAWRADGVTGYDLCFSAPKSVSALWALSDGKVPASIAAAHRGAVNAGLEYLDAHASASRVGVDGHTQVATAGHATAVFDHRTSRAGDPQLHTHALVVNKVRCGDGEWRTVDGAELFRHKKSAGAVYQAALRNELSMRLGVSWTEVSKDGQAEIAGVPAELIGLWSKRTAQVDGEAAPVIAGFEVELGRPLTSAERTAVTKVAVLKSRPSKDTVDIQSLFQRWETEAHAAGWDPARLLGAVTAAFRPRMGPEDAAGVVAEVLQTAVTAAGDRRSVFSRSDLAAEIAARVPSTGFTADLTRELVERWTDRALDTEAAVRLVDDRDGPARASDARYASQTTLDAELRVLSVADGGRSLGYGAVPAVIVGWIGRKRGLDPSQLTALMQVIGSGDALSVVVAPAGTGKTTAMGAAVQAWQHHGHRVLALAPSARAARELQDATGVPADTVAKFLHEQQRSPHHAPTSLQATRQARYQVRAGGVMIVDEASMLPTRDLDSLTRLTSQAGAKLLLVGDPAQIGAVDAASGMLPALADRLGAPSLEAVHRFTEPWERHASLQLRRGDPAVIDTYTGAGRIHDCPDETVAFDAVLKHYQRARDGGAAVLLLARTRHDVDELNTRARAQAITAGEVHGPVIHYGPREWRAGDRLRATRNNRTVTIGEDYLRNGDQFTVLTAGAGGLVVRAMSDPALVATLPVDYVDTHTAYGWAATIDTAQGATVDHGILLARPGIDREHLYVGLTRGRESNHVYLAPPATANEHEQPAPPGPARQVMIDALQSSDLQAAAHTRLAEPVAVPPAPERQRPSRRPDPRLSPGLFSPDREWQRRLPAGRGGGGRGR